MIGVVVSRADHASVHIGEHLLDLAEWRATTDERRPDAAGGGTVHRTDGFALREFDELHLHLDGVADAFDDPEFVVFASRHSGDTGPLLTAHFTGNLGPAEYGGADGDLAAACPNALAAVVAALDDHAPEGYEVGMEGTHHGPSSVGAPSMFVEVGSDEPQWNDPEAARAVARAILDLREVPANRTAAPPGGAVPGGAAESPVAADSAAESSVAADRAAESSVAADRAAESSVAADSTRSADHRHLAWFGGGHYAPRPARVLRETDWAVGHVATDWALDAMGDPAANEAVVARVLDRSPAMLAVVQDDRPDLAAVVESLGYRVVSETWVRETDGVALPLVAAMEDALGPVDDGLRFGEAARGRDLGGGLDDAAAEFAIVDLPADLLAAAQGVDLDAANAAVAAGSLAHETEEAGTRVAGRAAVPSAAARDDIVDGLVEVLRERYDAVERDGDAVVARESAFDPALARERGVEEGPAFGRLADGQPVTVDGRAVRPGEVHVERTRRFPL